MLKISATQLEAFRRYQSGKISWTMLEDTILKKSPPSPLMALGTLFHELLQADTVTPDDCAPYFDYEDITEARKKVNYSCKAFEFKLRAVVQTHYGMEVAITGVADQILPGQVVEFKTRYSPFQYESYSDSMQWRLYCMLFDVPCVNYKVWELKRDEDTNACKVKAYNDFVLYTYANMERELMQSVTEFTQLLERYGLSSHPLLQIDMQTA
jgi:hypothetical protein